MVGTTALVHEVTGGVDTHADTHTAAALDERGRLLGHATFRATPAGYDELLDWLTGHGQVATVGVEGTGSYGAGLARHLRAEGVRIVVVDRPDRRARRSNGKSDPVDAVAAARAVQAGTAAGIPKSRDGVVESIRALRVARNGAIKSHTAAMNALRQMLITAPDHLRQQMTGLGPKTLVNACARLRPGDLATQPRVSRPPSGGWRVAVRCWPRRSLRQTETSLPSWARPHPTFWIGSGSGSRSPGNY
jgi:transposase